MLQSQIINALPRRILAKLWASKETRISLSHLQLIQTSSNHKQNMPLATTPSFLCSELPIRYTHLLRLLSTQTAETLQSPVIKHIAHQYLHDICTLLHPSLLATSPRAFTDVLCRLRQRQAASLIRLRYALLYTPTAASVALLENMQTIGFGIHQIIDQHVAWATHSRSTCKTNRVQSTCAVAIARQAAENARSALRTSLGDDIPSIHIKQQSDTIPFTFAPQVLHRILYETMTIALRANIMQQRLQSRSWRDVWKRWWPRSSHENALDVHVFGGPTSVGFKLDSRTPLLHGDLLQDIPRDAIGIPTCASVLSRTKSDQLSSDDDDSLPDLECEVHNGWRSAKLLASHWGGNLDAISIDGLGTTMYLALDRDTSLLERYPSRWTSTQNTALSLSNATAQLDAFLYAISDPQQIHQYQPFKHDHHAVSLSAAVGHA
ncbi:uncharacterized protein BYT42DRAFT_570523 [Radiomyces spectabilis]|uniref:uncharacterized protein n=1 Tax=Radiomyces spectabilis TaxID=64574 RepID=UPI00222113AF|nr:uncharacterized protein BYT42DRAFT_570523 [Radiomyces spectabilis]KAI8377501.1 hypothetical protein BYT42DRAFT_570523 [Radiomyces spectabilis]